MTINEELWLIMVPTFSGILFALGGTRLTDTIQGKKWIRRFALPTLLAITVFGGGFHWWQSLLVFGISCGAFHLGYGDKTPWPMKWLVFSSYGLISLPIGISWWNLVAGVLPTPIMWLSQVRFFKKMFVWKICEVTFGLLVGLTIAFLLAGNGMSWGKQRTSQVSTNHLELLVIKGE